MTALANSHPDVDAPPLPRFDSACGEPLRVVGA
jgi:hypothetical protein